MKIRDALLSSGTAALLAFGALGGITSPAAAQPGPGDAVAQSTSVDDGRTDSSSASVSAPTATDNAERAGSGSERGLGRCWNGRVSGRDF
ncbi:hypothetical protein ACSNOK_34370, partial [Streptomyces sp. URMC 126]